MKNKKIMLIIIFFCSWIFIASALHADNELLMSVKMERISRLPYLPVYFDIEFHNTSSQDILFPHKNCFRDYLQIIVEGSKQDLHCFEKESEERLSAIKLFTIKAGATYVYNLDVAQYAGILDPGAYRVKVVWDSRKAPKGYQELEESQWIDIQIDEARGEDKSLIDEFKVLYNAVPKCIFLGNGRLSEDFISKYPTSTYAGWALKSLHPGAFPILGSGQKLLDDLLLPYNIRKGYTGSLDEKDKNKWITPEEQAKRYEKYAEIYLSAHSDSDLSLLILMRLGMAKAVLHKWDEAYAAMDKSLSKKWPEWYINENTLIITDWRKILGELKEELIKRNLAHKK